MKLFNSRREKKASHNQEQGDEDEVEEEWKQGEEERAGDVPDGVTGFPDHLGGHADPLEAAAEEEAQQAGQHAEHHAQPQPEPGAAGHPRHHPLGAGQEDVVVRAAVGRESAVLRVGVDRQAGGETHSAAQDAHPDGRHGAAVQEP